MGAARSPLGRAKRGPPDVCMSSPCRSVGRAISNLFCQQKHLLPLFERAPGKRGGAAEWGAMARSVNGCCGCSSRISSVGHEGAMKPNQACEPGASWDILWMLMRDGSPNHLQQRFPLEVLWPLPWGRPCRPLFHDQARTGATSQPWLCVPFGMAPPLHLAGRDQRLSAGHRTLLGFRGAV